MASDYSIHNPARHRYPLMDFVPPHSAFINGNQQEWASNADQVEAGYHKTTSNVPPVTSLLSSFTGRIRSIRVGFQMPTPSLARFILLCSLWYFSSAMSSNTGKVIMNQFRFPITLTFIQFAFVAGYCLLCTSKPIGLSRFRYPTRQILRNTFPMALFQVGGHIFSSMAISRIPVSTVHTIKALSPLFTVGTYAVLFGVSYSSKTYISLLPLTIGVMLATTFDMSGANTVGLLCAFGSAIVFVSSNIFFKKIMPSHTNPSRETTTQKLDKLNLLFYSSGMAFLMMVPLWMFYDLPSIISGNIPAPKAGAQSHNIPLYFFLNGTVHFGQNILAFNILQSCSPVTYSIASLIKRVAVILIAIVWFSQPVHPVQAMGICLTFVGLWMYNTAKESVEKGEKKMQRVEASRNMMLPTTKEESLTMSPSSLMSPISAPRNTNGQMNPAEAHVHSLDSKQLPVPIIRGPSVYPSPPHSPPLSQPPLSATAPSYHPTAIQQRKAAFGKPHASTPEPLPRAITVL